MASKGLRAISCPVTQKIEADYKPTQTNETLIGYDRVLTPVTFSIHLSVLFIEPFVFRFSWPYSLLSVLF
jgi:hypothetical protein